MTHAWWLALALTTAACKGGEPPPPPATTSIELAPTEEREVRLAVPEDLAASVPKLVVEGSSKPVVDAVRAVIDQRKLADTGSLVIRVTTEPADLAAAATAKIEITGHWLALPRHTRLSLTLAGRVVKGRDADLAAVGTALGERIAAAIDKAEPDGAYVPKPAGPATAVEVGDGLACSLHADKTVACWGRAQAAQALWARVPTHVPVFDVVQLGVAGEHACALHRAGGVSCWGVFGTDRTGESSVLANACGTRDATALAVGETQICTQSPAGVACWPAARTFDPACTPVPVSGLGTRVTALVAGPQQVCALDGGKVRCWGACDAAGCKAGPPVLTGVTAFDVGAEACGVTAKGEVACATKDRPPHAGIALPAGSRLALEASYGCAVTPDHRPLCWGSNRSGELGDGTTDARLEPVAPQAIPDAIAIDPGATEACAVTKAGAVWCWGTVRGGTLMGPAQLAIY